MSRNYTQWVQSVFQASPWQTVADFDSEGTVRFTLNDHLELALQPTVAGTVLLSGVIISEESGDILDAKSLQKALQFGWLRLPDSPFNIGYSKLEKSLLLLTTFVPEMTKPEKALELMDEFCQEVSAWVAHLYDLNSAATPQVSLQSHSSPGFMRP